MTGAIGLWMRADWRRRRLSLAALTLLIGIAFAFVATALAGARRTASSFDRLRAQTRAYDHGVVIDSPGASERPGRDHYDDATVRRIRALPEISDEATVTTYVASLANADWEFGLLAPEDGRFGSLIERPRIIRGRPPDPKPADEVAINESGARQAHADVGALLDLVTLSPEQRMRIIAGDPHAFDHGALGPDLRVRVVGVYRGAADVVGRSDPTIVASPAFDHAYRGRMAYSSRTILVRRSNGTSGRALHAAVDRITSGKPLGVFDAATEDKPARQTVHTLSVGLLVFALVAAIASILAVAQAVARHVAAGEADQSVLGTLGLTRLQRMRGLLGSIAPAAVVGALVAAAGSTAASSLMPVGLARRIEPSPGLRFDPLVAGLAALSVVVIVLVAGLLASARMTSTRHVRRRGVRASRIVASAAGAGPVAATGIRLAFDRRPPALPVRSTFIAVTAAVVVLVGALTFSASLDRLARDHERWGFGWDLMLDTTDAGTSAISRQLAANRDLGGVSVLSSGFTFARGANGIRAYGLDDVRGPIGFALRSGVQPVGSDEVVVGPVTARKLRIHVGDTTQIVECPCNGTVVAAKMTRARVVGVALFPEDDDGNFTDALGFSGAGFRHHVGSSDNTRMAVRIARGRSLSAVARDLGARYPGQLSRYSYPERPGEVENLTGLRRFPRVLAAFTALLGLAALTNVLVSSVRRRRRELATLRSLGLTPRQIGRCISWQGVSTTVVALVVGIPLGAVVGGRVWQAATRSVGVATDASRPLLAIASLSLAAIVVTIAVSLPVGWRASRIQPAQTLRTE